MATNSDLPIDLVEEEILSRLPLLSLGPVRSTCKKWDALCKTPMFFGKAKAAARKKQFVGFMMMDYRVCSLKPDLQGIRNDGDSFDLSIKQDKAGLVVWNPYLGQTRWIQPRRREFDRFDVYGLGFDKDRNHKVLRIFFDRENVLGYAIYDLSSNSWKVAYVTVDWDMSPDQRGVSLQGNTYLFASRKT